MESARALTFFAIKLIAIEQSIDKNFPFRSGSIWRRIWCVNWILVHNMGFRRSLPEETWNVFFWDLLCVAFRKEGRLSMYLRKRVRGFCSLRVRKPKAWGHPVQPWVQRRATPLDSTDLVNLPLYWHFGRFSLWALPRSCQASPSIDQPPRCSYTP